MRALITGGIGFIGTNLSDRLLRDGHDVVLFDNVSRLGVRQNLDWLRSRDGDRLQFVEGDVRDFNSVEKAMQGASAVFHLAAQEAVTTSVVNPRDDFSINAQGTLNVLEAARQQKPMPVFLYTSTNKVYGGLDHLRVVERPLATSLRIFPTACQKHVPSISTHLTDVRRARRISTCATTTAFMVCLASSFGCLAFTDHIRWEPKTKDGWRTLHSQA